MQTQERTGRRGALRCLAAALLAGAAFAASPLGARADQPSIEISVHPQWSGTFDVSSWLPVQVTLHNKGASAFHGRVEVTTNAPSSNGFTRCFSTGIGSACSSVGSAPQQGSAGSVDYATPVVLAAGVTKTVTVTVLPGDPSAQVQVVGDDGTVVASTQYGLDVSLGIRRIVIGVVSGYSGAMDGMGAVRGPSGGQVQVVHIRPADLPDNAVPLQAFDALVLDGAPTDTLGAAQSQALADYVEGGGSLLVVAGDAVKATIAGLPRGLVPATLSGGTTQLGLRDLSTLLGVNPPNGATTAQLVRAVGTVALHDGSTPVLVVAKHGRGQSALLTVDPGTEPLLSWAGGSALLRELVVRMSHAFAPGAVQTGFNGTAAPHAALASETGSMASVVSLIPGVTLPDAAILSLLAAGYIVVAGPVSYLVLRRLRRRDLYWVTVPVLAYSTGLGASGRNLTLSEVRVVHLTPGSQRAGVDTFAAAFSAHGGDYTLALPGSSYVSGLAAGDGGTITVAPSGDSVLAEFHSGAAAVRGFSATRSAQLGGRIDASLHDDGQSINGTVTNHLGVDLSDVRLVWGGNTNTVVSLGDMANGKSLQVNASRPSNVNGMCCGPAISVVPYPSYGGPGSDVYRRSQLLNALPQIAGSLDGPVLLALARSPLLGDDVHGDGVDSTVQDAVVMPLAGAPLAASTSLHNLPATLVDLVESSNFGAAGSTGGQAVFEASLPGRSWQNLSVSVDLNACPGKGMCIVHGGPVVTPVSPPMPVPNCPGCPRAIAPQPSYGIASPSSNGTIASPVLQAWDVQAHRWFDVSSSSGASQINSALSAQQVVDDDGNVLLRVVGVSTASVTVSADPGTAA